MATQTETPGLWYIPTVIPSVDEAKQTASFELWLPAALPAGFAVSRIRHHWPNWVPRDREHPRSDFMEVQYSGPFGGDLEVLHGFFSRYISSQELAPEGHKGTFDLNGVTAYWMSVKAQGIAQVNGRYVPARWDPGFAAVAWETDVDEDSHIYFSMSSNTLTVDDLRTMAPSVRPA